MLVLASFKTETLPIPEDIGVTPAGMNDGKEYETISYDNQVS